MMVKRTGFSHPTGVLLSVTPGLGFVVVAIFLLLFFHHGVCSLGFLQVI